MVRPALSIVVALAAVLVVLSGCFGTDGRCDGNAYAVVTTNFGIMVWEVYEDLVPQTADYFLDLAEAGSYNGLNFTEIGNGDADRPLALAGDLTGIDGAAVARGQALPRESHSTLSHDSNGVISKASGSQFFLMFDRVPGYDDSHTVFARVSQGMDVVAALEYVAATPSGVPLQNVTLQSIKVTCKEPVERITANLITPGLWEVRSDTEYIMAWAHNGHDQSKQVQWLVTAPGRTTLPEGWSLTPSSSAATLGRDQSLRPAAEFQYADWAWTIFTLRLPTNTEIADYPLELHVGDAMTPFILRVLDTQGTVAAPGDNVHVHYFGRFADTKVDFDNGDFPTTIGAGDLITGFDLGMVGLAIGEPKILHIPAALAYGFGIPEDTYYAQFDGRDLHFRITLSSIAS